MKGRKGQPPPAVAQGAAPPGRARPGWPPGKARRAVLSPPEQPAVWESAVRPLSFLRPRPAAPWFWGGSGSVARGALAAERASRGWSCERGGWEFAAQTERRPAAQAELPDRRPPDGVQRGPEPRRQCRPSPLRSFSALPQWTRQAQPRAAERAGGESRPPARLPLPPLLREARPQERRAAPARTHRGSSPEPDRRRRPRSNSSGSFSR